MELHDALGSTLTCRGLLPWLVITCKVVWKEVCPSIVVFVIKQVSMLDMGFTVMKWLTCCGEMLSDFISGIRHLINLLWLLVALAAVFVLWQWCLYLLEVGCTCHFCDGGSDSSGLCAWCCMVDTITVTAGSLTGVQVTCGSVGGHVSMMGCLLVIVLQRGCFCTNGLERMTLTKMVLKRE